LKLNCSNEYFYFFPYPKKQKYARAPIEAKINQCHEASKLIGKLSRHIFIAYPQDEAKKQPVPWHVGLAPVKICVVVKK